jgi:hypothetical protein
MAGSVLMTGFPQQWRRLRSRRHRLFFPVGGRIPDDDVRNAGLLAKTRLGEIRCNKVVVDRRGRIAVFIDDESGKEGFFGHGLFLSGLDRVQLRSPKSQQRRPAMVVLTLGDQDGPGPPRLERLGTTDNEDLIRVGLEQHQDAVTDPPRTR